MDSSKGEKTITYFRMLSALGKQGCGICHVMIETGSRLLDGLFYELVNDGPTRELLYASNGFCNKHAWQSVEMPSTQSGLAVIYQGVVENILKRFGQSMSRIGHQRKTLVSKPRKYRASIPLLEQTAVCQICCHAFATADACLGELVRYFDDKAVRTAFDASFGLCLPHTDRAVRIVPNGKNLITLLEIQSAKCEKLNLELKEMIRKQSYQYVNEQRGEEMSSWKRVVEMVAGKPGVFQ